MAFSYSLKAQEFVSGLVSQQKGASVSPSRESPFTRNHHFVLFHGLGLGGLGPFAGPPNPRPFTSKGRVQVGGCCLDAILLLNHFLVKGFPMPSILLQQLWGVRPYNENKSLF